MSDSDDDLPISDLIKKRKTQEKNVVSKKPATSSSSSDSGSKSNSSSSSSSKETKKEVTTVAEYYDQTDKGELIQRLLQRWWYAIVWPKEEDIANPPPGYEALDGFKGVFISTRMDSLGDILDLRDKKTCPSFRNLNEFHSSKLQDLCITAYETQMKLLEQHEPGSNLMKELKSDLREVKKINADAAEKDAARYKKNLSLSQN